MSPWHLARATGLFAYAAFAIAMIAGLMLSSKYLGKRSARNLTLLHEALSIAGLLLMAVHAWAILNDAYFEFTWQAIMIPGLSPYEPAAVAAGVIAGWVGLVVVASFYLRKRIGPRTWRKIHYSTFGMFVLMTAHGFFSGTDSANPFVLGLYSGATGSILVLTLYRATTAYFARRKKARRASARAGSVA